MLRLAFIPPALIIGDVIALIAAVPISLAIRTLSIPSLHLVFLHLVPFSILALVSVSVFFSAGLYDMAHALIRRDLPGTILGAQVFNVIIAALVFFFVPIFGITPKITLVAYLFVSVALVTAWRLFALQGARTKEEHAVIIGTGPDIADLLDECSPYGLCPFARTTTVVPREGEGFETEVRQALGQRPTFVIASLDDPLLAPVLPALYAHIETGGRFVDFTELYERVFHRVPLSTLSYQWFLSSPPVTRIFFDITKRALDMLLSIPLIIVLCVLMPFVALALRLEGNGPVFIRQERIGRDWTRMTVLKFRTMRFNKATSHEWTVEEKKDNPVTRVGALLRRASIDELPQVFSVLSGDLSLIGPRSDIAGLGERLAEELPFYRARYAVTPGISGWAQVNQRYAPGNLSPQSIDESRVRLAYDLYYVKHRSPLLDISITLRTAKTLVSRLFA